MRLLRITESRMEAWMKHAADIQHTFWSMTLEQSGSHASRKADDEHFN